MIDNEEERSAAKAESGAAPSPLHRDLPIGEPIGETESIGPIGEIAPIGETAPAGETEAHASGGGESSLGLEEPHVASELVPEKPAGPASQAAAQRSRAGPFGATIASAILLLGVIFGLRYYDQSLTPTENLESRLAALDARADSIDRNSDASTAAWHSALGALEDRVSAASKAAAASASALIEIQKTLAARPPTLVATADGQQIELPDLAPLEARIETIEKKLGSLEAALSAPKVDVRPQQDRENAAVEQGSHAQAIAIVAGSLVAKLERGLPFSDEITALQNLGVGQGELLSLSSLAKTGVASAGALADQFASLASSIIASEDAAETNENGSFVDKLAHSASSLVHVRRDDDVNGKDIRSLVARIKAALAHDNVEDAFALWNEMPSVAKTKSERWGEAAKARLSALNAARAIDADAVAVLGKPKS